MSIVSTSREGLDLNTSYWQDALAETHNSSSQVSISSYSRHDTPVGIQNIASLNAARFATSADMATGLVDTAHDQGFSTRPHRGQYPHWFGEVTLYSHKGNQGYRFGGKAPQVDNLGDMIDHKHSLDYARRDLMNTAPRHKRGESYRDAAKDVILAHHYLIARVYEWGSRNPNDNSFGQPRYQELIRDLWLESLSMMTEYEQYNDNDSWVRENLFRHLYLTLKETKLDNRYQFYNNLVEEIRKAIY